MLLNTTIGGSSADSFIAIDEADTFLSGGPYNTDGWAELSDDQKVLRLVLAAKLMGCMTWAKFPVYDRQALCFPRRGPKCREGSVNTEKELAAALIIPEAIKKAQAWIAWDVIHRGLVEASYSPPQNGAAYPDVTSLSLGGAISVSLSRNADTPGDQTQFALAMSSCHSAIYLLLSPYLSSVSAVPRTGAPRLLPAII